MCNCITTFFNPPLAGTPTEIIQPMVTLRSWFIKLKHLPHSRPQTAGLRKITSNDIPSALAVTNKYTSQFEIGHVFQSEEEFSYWFLPPSVPNEGDVVFFTYVVKNPTAGNVTDMFSIVITDIRNPQYGYVTAIVNTKTPAKQLITDLLLCAKQEVLEIFTYQFGHKREVFEETFSTLLFEPHYRSIPLYLYNYNYLEVDEEKFVLYPYIGYHNYNASMTVTIKS